MHMNSFGIGSFEFPIPGDYEVRKGSEATQLFDDSAGRTITVGMFSRPVDNGSTAPERIQQIVELAERSWQRFAQDEGGQIVVPLMRSDVGPTLTVASMATEFAEVTGTQYYINVAATDGTDVAFIAIEGLGRAKLAHESLLPLVEAVRFSPQGKNLP